MVRELLVFAVVFGLACWISRPNAEELMLKWRNGVRPLFRGIFWSIGLRLGTMAILFLIGILMVAAGSDPGAIAKLRPDIEEMVNARALLNDPRYFILNLTLVSFVVGGLREELWRAGMLADPDCTAPFHAMFALPWRMAFAADKADAKFTETGSVTCFAALPESPPRSPVFRVPTFAPAISRPPETPLIGSV